jgi:hypothetical protein
VSNKAIGEPLVISEAAVRKQVVVPVLESHGGHACRFLGDGVLGVVGAPRALPDRADRGVAAARAIAAAVDEHLGDPCRVSVGVNVVLNRAFVYTALTATLAGAYVGSVLLLQLVLSPSSDFAIAASTLAVAGLVQPARPGIQEIVDRRFHRAPSRRSGAGFATNSTSTLNRAS